ncbi:MAG: carbon starvation protein A [Elusimicrobiota bacterium]|jgi:carbon starvation protein CstA|nr:carbon starvation protein A [Elusimicrobiota bacterium]
MITFVLSLILLVGGYFIYGAFVEKTFGADINREMPSKTCYDGVDYVPLGWKKIFLIQFLNIAGLGPIFGAIMGAMFGPAAFLWIVFGSIFGGAVHDYLSGMLSVRNKGMSLPELSGLYFGVSFKNIMRVFTIVLMVLVGAVFIAGPARLLTNLVSGHLSYAFWCVVVFIYYALATLLPIDKIIGKIYPFFGFALFFMAAGICLMIFMHNPPIPELSLANLHNMHPDPGHYPLFPMMFISIACGAVSGFHATQSPMMARCLQNEKQGRRVFYGAMIAEGIVALIWAAAAMSFFGDVGGLQEFLKNNGNNVAVVVDKISYTWLGKVGGVLAIIGVIAAPITSGDTAFRAARLIIADLSGYNQKPLINRIIIAAPLFIVGFIILQVNFDVLWRYFAWANQTLAASTLWLVTVYLARNNKNFWISLIPALFMTSVVVSYIIIAPEGFKLPLTLGVSAGIAAALLLAFYFFFKLGKQKRGSFSKESL